MAQFGEGAAEVQLPGNANGEGPGNPSDTCMNLAIPMGAIFILFYFIMLRPQRRKEKQRRDQLASLKKNNHVVTTGGIHGIVTNVKPDEDEVTIRVDDVTNTKLRVSRGSIARVIGPESSDGSEKGD